MLNLLPCDYRGPSPDGGRRYVCTHVRLCAPAKATTVLATTCHDCEFGKWAPEAALAEYKPRWPGTSPTRAQYGARLAVCDPCGHRRENYCRRAGGACGLLANLAKGSFVCPVGVFGKPGTEPAPPPPPAAPLVEEVTP